MSVQIQVRRGTASQWTTANTILASGEIGFETDTGKFKIGTGSAAWSTLPYASISSDSPTFTGTVVLPSTTSIGNVSSTEIGYLDGVTSAIQTQFSNKSDKSLTLNTRTASYTLVLSDNNKIIEMDVSTANDLTIPLNSSVQFPLGSVIDIVQIGDGQTTIVPTSGVTLLSKDNYTKLSEKYSAVTLYKKDTNTWVLIGDLSA